MSWSGLAVGSKQTGLPASRTAPTLRLLHLQVIAALSSVIFAFNFCLEILVLFSGSRSHKMLILTTAICLAIWAFAELAILNRRQPAGPTVWLGVLLVTQILLEAARLLLVILGPPLGIEKSFGISIANFSLLPILIPLYIVVFFGIMKSLMMIYRWELEDAWEKLTELAVAESKQQEREQLLRDVHDGFGSELASARIAVERGTLSQREMATFLSKCIADLRLIVNVTGSEAGKLEEVIAEWRYRVSRQLAGEPFRLIWEVNLQGAPQVTQRASLQVLRIAQEALFNATRHSGASEIRIKAGHADGVVTLMVSDNGKGLLLSDHAPPSNHGKGLASMRARAREIGASLDISFDGGCTIELRYRPDQQIIRNKQEDDAGA